MKRLQKRWRKGYDGLQAQLMDFRQAGLRGLAGQRMISLYVKGYRFNFAGNDRLTNKKIFAMKALDLLRTELLEQN
jgi:hypothetical protein